MSNKHPWLNLDTQPGVYLTKEIFGWSTTILLALLYVPQVYKVYRKKDGQAMAKSFLLISLLLTFISIIYGFLLWEWPLMVANVFVFVCTLLLVAARYLFKKPSPEPTEIDVEKSASDS